MKKILAIGVLTICSIAFTQQQASAWINSRFGVGLNWDWQSGGNSILWGAWRNGQPGGPDPAPGGPLKQHYAPHFQPYCPPPAAPAYAPAPLGHSAAPATTPMAAYPGNQFAMPYQFATYPRPVQYNYGNPYYR